MRLIKNNAAALHYSDEPPNSRKYNSLPCQFKLYFMIQARPTHRPETKSIITSSSSSETSWGYPTSILSSSSIIPFGSLDENGATAGRGSSLSLARPVNRVPMRKAKRECACFYLLFVDFIEDPSSRRTWGKFRSSYLRPCFDQRLILLVVSQESRELIPPMKIWPNREYQCCTVFSERILSRFYSPICHERGT